MSEFQKYRVLAVMVSFMLLVSACGSSAQPDSVISTAVAQTVQAGESLTEIASLPTTVRGPSCLAPLSVGARGRTGARAGAPA